MTPATKDALEAFEKLRVDIENDKKLLYPERRLLWETIRQALARQDAPTVTADEAQRVLESFNDSWNMHQFTRGYSFMAPVYAETIRSLLAERAGR